MIAEEEGKRKDDRCDYRDDHEGIEVGEKACLLREERAEPSLRMLFGTGAESASAEVCGKAVEELLEASVG